MYTFCYICQSGKYEKMSILLTKSIRHLYKNSVDIVVGIPLPERTFSSILPSTKTFFQQHKVKIIYFTNNLNYKIANKLLLMQEAIKHIRTSTLIFLDSDMLAMDNRIDLQIKTNEIGLLLVGHNNPYAKNKEFWDKVTQDLRLPPITETTTSNNKTMYPYYNAGFIAVHKSNSSFIAEWLEILKWYLRRTQYYQQFNVQRSYSDQITLVLTLHKYNYYVKRIANGYNYNSVFLLKPDPPKLYFIHYHRHDYREVETLKNYTEMLNKN